MATILTTIKVTVETARNFKGAAYLLNKKQYEAAELASEMFLTHLEKITRKKSNKTSKK